MWRSGGAGKRIRLLILALLLVVLGGSAVHAEGLSREAAVALALEQNPSIRAARQEAAAAEGRALQARAIPDPEISIEINGIRSGFRLGGAEERKIGIVQPFEFPGKRALRSDLGENDLARARLRLALVKRLVTAEVHKAFFRVLAEEETLVMLRALLHTLEQLQETVIARYRAGTVPYIEINRTRIEGGRLQNELREGERQVQAARRALNVLMGREEGTPLRIEGDLDAAIPLPRPESSEEMLKGSLALKIRSLEVASSEKALELGRMSYYPDFRVGVFSDRLDGPEPIRGWALQAGVSVPLWWPWKQRGTVREAEALREASRVRLEAAGREALRAAADAAQRAEVARSQVSSYRRRLLPEAEDAFHAGLTHYQYGKIDTLNLIDLYRAYRAVKLQAIRARLEYAEALAERSVAGERVGE